MKNDTDIIADCLQKELPPHLLAALQNGPTKAELADIFTYIVLYAGPLTDEGFDADLNIKNGDDYAKANAG